MNFKQELKRKLVHLSSTAYPLLYYITNKSFIFVVILTIFCGVLLWDLLRIRGLSFKSLNFLNSFLRAEEKNNKKLTGATYFMMSLMLVIVFFPKNIAVLSILILIYADTAASLFGRFGKMKIKSLSKTLEGFIAYNFIGIIVILLYADFISQVSTFKLNLLFATIALLVSGILELSAKKLRIDDNLLIAVSFATIYSLLHYLNNII